MAHFRWITGSGEFNVAFTILLDINTDIEYIETSRVQNNFFFDFWKVLLISGVSNLTNDVVDIKNCLSPNTTPRRQIEI